ncbi:MAG: ABC transporter ATPase [Bacteroidetes bacterium]|nr:ABC transporter ATPase [Bacteroidota bacterium]
MPQTARVWVYQSNRLLTDAEISAIKKAGIGFIADWAAHGASLKASFDALYNRFIVIAVDEQQALASGCSIDKSVKFIKDLEQQFDLNLFDRLQVAYRKGNEIVVCHLSEFEKLAQQGIVNESTIVFNNMVTTKATFDKDWEIPLSGSWQKRVLV